MSLKQDYILRIVEQIITLIMERSLGTGKKEELQNQISNDKNINYMYERLKYLIDTGNINESENQLFDFIKDNSLGYLRLALLYYDYLNSKSEEFLEKNNFSREEIKDGLLDISKNFGYENIVSIYLI